MSINVGRGGQSHDIALSRAYELGVDVVLIQEPLWKKITNEIKSHPGYDCHIPHGGVNARPRALTYTLINRRIYSATQIFPCDPLTADCCWVLVNGVTLLNVYKEPIDPTAIRQILSWVPPTQSVAAGDFNAVHCAWQSGITHLRGQGIEIER